MSPVSARAHALDLLARKDWTRHAMMTRLQADGFAAGDSADAVQYLATSGYLDDRRFAERFLASVRAARGRGRAWLERELSIRGVPDDAIREALSLTRDPAAELEEAVTLAMKLTRQKPGLSRQRLGARLASRGFDADLIIRALDRLQRSRGEDAES